MRCDMQVLCQVVARVLQGPLPTDRPTAYRAAGGGLPSDREGGRGGGRYRCKASPRNNLAPVSLPPDPAISPRLLPSVQCLLYLGGGDFYVK